MKKKLKFNQNDNIKILVIRFKRIGDAILCLPLCNSLKLTFPNARVDYVLYEEIAHLFYGHPYADNIITIKEKNRKNILNYLKNVYRITREKYDIIIDVMSTPKSELFCLFSLSSPYRIGRFNKKRGIFYTHKQKEPESLNKVDKFLRQLLSPLENDGYKLRLNLDFKFKAKMAEKEKYRKLMEKSGINFSKKVVAFSIYSRVKSKIYPMEKMKKVVQYLIDKYDTQIIFFYSKDQKEAIKKIHSDIGNNKNIFSDIETPTIKDLVPLLENCDYFIGNEGGGRHLAQAVGISSLGIYGPNADLKEWLPFPSNKNMGIMPINTLDYHSISKEEYQKLSHIEKWNLIEPKMITNLIDKLFIE